MKEETKRDILIITADAVKDTGLISFKFMFDADKERKVEMPNNFGFIRKCNDEGEYSFNVFGDGRLISGGGWTPHDSFEWQETMLDAIPSCTLLMDIDLLPWWTELTKQHSVEFRHHHFNGILKTS